MSEQPWTTLLDEAGNIGPAQGELIVIACVTVLRLRDLELAVRYVRKRLSPRLRATPEFKFHSSSEPVRLKLLNRLAKIEHLEIDATIIERGRLSKKLTPDEHYFAAIAETTLRIRQRHPDLRVLIDRRYTKPSMQDSLAAVIRYAGRELPGRIEIEQIASQRTIAIQAADFVAGAIFHREARGTPHYGEIIRSKIASEVLYGEK